MIESDAVAPYRDATANAIHPYEGVTRMSLAPVNPRHVWEDAARLFDQLFYNHLWAWRATLRQAIDDRALLAAIRETFRKRPKRHALRDQMARIMVQRAVEKATARIPDHWSAPPALN